MTLMKPHPCVGGRHTELDGRQVGRGAAWDGDVEAWHGGGRDACQASGGREKSEVGAGAANRFS